MDLELVERKVRSVDPQGQIEALAVTTAGGRIRNISVVEGTVLWSRPLPAGSRTPGREWIVHRFAIRDAVAELFGGDYYLGDDASTFGWNSFGERSGLAARLEEVGSR
jgi:hypothetical protein